MYICRYCGLTARTYHECAADCQARILEFAEQLRKDNTDAELRRILRHFLDGEKQQCETSLSQTAT